MISCNICQKEYSSEGFLQFHLTRDHKFDMVQIKEYYDLYLKTDNEGIDPFTGNETKFIGLTAGYSKFDGSEESNRKKIASSSVEYWVKVKGYTETQAIEYLNDKHKRSAKNANKTKKKLLEENPERRFLGGYGVKKFMLMGYSKDDAIKKHKQIKKQRYINYLKTYEENPDMFKGKLPSQIEYWVNKGYSETDAKIKVKESQSTFTLKKCIKKYGITEGTKKFNDRQTKWSSLIEKKYKNGEFTRFCKNNWSKVEEDFITTLVKKIGLPDTKYYSAINGRQFFRHFKNIGKTFAYDFKYGKKIIEFNGDYWHCNPAVYEADYYNASIGSTAAEKWKFDKFKNSLIENEGYQVLVIWERDWTNNPKSTIQKCLDFLKIK